MITIIDYGVGNLSSVRNMLRRLGAKSKICNKLSEIEHADKLILPGVGSFDYGMAQLKNSGLLDILNKRVLIDKVPILGICLGVQLMMEGSEEGNLPGLGWIKGKTIAFDKTRLNPNQKIPHMGWNHVKEYEESDLFKDMYDEPRFYFAHSYHLMTTRPEDVLLKTNYGCDFAAGIESGNIVGVQFHPEKSHKFGMKIFENFIKFY
jgi:glutamine amidotransferase